MKYTNGTVTSFIHAKYHIPYKVSLFKVFTWSLINISLLVNTRTSLVARTVKHLPTMRETRVRSLGRADPWRRKWQPTPVSLPGESHGGRSLVGYSLQGSQRVGHDWATSLSFSLSGPWHESSDPALQCTLSIYFCLGLWDTGLFQCI